MSVFKQGAFQNVGLRATEVSSSPLSIAFTLTNITPSHHMLEQAHLGIQSLQCHL